MLEAIGSAVMRILRILTPVELEKLSASAREKRKVAELGQTSAASTEVDQHSLGTAAFAQTQAQEKQAEVLSLQEHIEKKELQSIQEVEQALPQAVNSSPVFSQSLKSNTPQRGLESIGILSQDSLREIEARRREEEKRQTPSTSQFLLLEREKLRDTKEKMTGKTGIQTYKYQFNVDYRAPAKEILGEEADGEAPKNNSSGILINKKHF